MQHFVFYGFAALAVSLYAILPIIAKKLEVSMPPFAFIAITMAVLSSLALCVSLAIERPYNFAHLSATHFLLLFLFGAVNLVSFTLFLKAITGIPVAHYQLIGGLGPIVAAGLAFVFLGQQVGMRFFLAIPFILVGLYIALVK